VGLWLAKCTNILAEAGQPQPHLLSPLMTPLNEEKDVSEKTENEMEIIGNRIGNGIVCGFLYSPLEEKCGTLRSVLFD
jgi:hypothetical protein